MIDLIIIVMESVVGLKQPKTFAQQRRRSILVDYLISTSTHGLRSVGRAYSTCNRLCWVLMFLVASGFMCYFVVSAVLQYFAYPTQTKVEIVLDQAMAFPAVTFCSSNPNRYDKMNTSLVNLFYRLYPANTAFNQSVLDSLATPLFIDLLSRNQIEEWRAIGFQPSDMLLACTYNGIDCSKAFTPSISSVLGNCYTFNWKTSAELVTLNDFSNTFVLRAGLSMTFYVPHEIFFPTTFYGNSLIVLLHDNDELPLANENGLRLQPGLSHSIVYRKTVSRFLPSPYSKCTSKVASDLHSLYQTTFINESASASVAYSESVCRILCEQAYTFSQCSCILPLPFFTQHVLTIDGNLVAANICNPFSTQIGCAFSAKQQFTGSDQLQSLWCIHCAPQCTHTYFNADLSAESAPSEKEKQVWANQLLNGSNTTSILVPNDFAQRFDYYFERNYLKVLVSCGSKYVTEYNQEAKITLIDTFSAIGGQSGLLVYNLV